MKPCDSALQALIGSGSTTSFAASFCAIILPTCGPLPCVMTTLCPIFSILPFYVLQHTHLYIDFRFTLLVLGVKLRYHPGQGQHADSYVSLLQVNATDMP